MATRPLAFGVRFRDGARTVRVRQGRDSGYVLEVLRDGRPKQRAAHPELGSALRAFAQAWRQRLH